MNGFVAAVRAVSNSFSLYIDNVGVGCSSKNYDTEIFAFGHRVGAIGTAPDVIVRALTDESFYTRADVVEDTTGAQPSKDEIVGEQEHNTELISRGNEILSYVVLGYLRHSMPLAPEELVQAVASKVTSEDAIAQIASQLGFEQLVRTAEFPPNQMTLVKSFKALLAVLDRKRAESLILNVIIPQVLDVDFVEVYPLSDPLAVVTDLLVAGGSREVEPRLIHSAGEVSAEPVYMVGIYADKKLYGKSAGETVPVAVDMAARDALLNMWHLTPEYVLPLGAEAYSIALGAYQSPNFSLKEKCLERTDLTVSPFDDTDPLDVDTVAQRYWKETFPVVGQPLRRRLRHKFSRGSLKKRSFRYLVKPKPFTVC